MAANYSEYDEPVPHPYLREPKLYVSGLAGGITKEHLGDLFRYCTPFRPMFPVDGEGRLLPGYIEFRALETAERALATLQNRPLPPDSDAPTCNIVLSPFPPTSPPRSLPPPSALPRLVKHLPSDITDAELYDLFRPFGPLANVRSEAGFGPNIGVVEFWSEDDARRAEEAMHCAEVGDQNISVQVYQPRRAPPGAQTNFRANAPPFVPASLMYQQQQPTPPQNYSPQGGPPPLFIKRTSTPLSATGSLSDPPRTSSPSGSLLPGSEKDKLLAAVSRLDAFNAAEITNLLMSLPKKERAMCLFNPEYLKNKVAEAKVVLEADDEAEAQSVSTALTAAPTNPAKRKQGLGSAIMSPQTSAISPHGTSAAATPEVPRTPAIPPAAVHTLASLARLPATEIIKLANSPNATGLPLAKADPEVVKTTDEFIDSLNGQSEQQKKQVVGTKLFKAVKAYGIRNAKITLHLLNTEDLRALTHLMNSYPSVLKEKVQQAATATAAK